MSTANKKFNWKKASTIFFTVVLIIRALVWIFGNPAPSCTSTETKEKFSKIIHRKMDQPEFEGLTASITNHRQVSSSKEGRVCEADITLTDTDNRSLKGVRQYEIKKNGKHYAIHVD